MTKQKWHNVLFFLLMCLILFFYLIPVFFQVITAFKADKEITLLGFRWFPETLRFDAFTSAWKMANWPQAFMNSVVMTISVIVVCLSINLLAGYAFARLHFRGSDVLFIILLMGLMIPAQSIIIPQFIIVRGMGLYDTIWGSAICYLSAPMGVFLAKQFYLTFPKELDEAAFIDGASTFQTFTHIMMPSVRSVSLCVLVMSLVYNWNDFFTPLIYINSTKKFTLAIGLQFLNSSMGTTKIGQMMAVAVATMIPVLIIFFLCQKYFVEGIKMSGINRRKAIIIMAKMVRFGLVQMYFADHRFLFRECGNSN